MKRFLTDSFLNLFFMSTDEGGNGGGGTSDADGKNTGEGEGEDTSSEGQEKKFSQKDLDELLGKTRKEEKKKYEQQKQKEQEEAQRKADEESGKFQKLYEELKQKETSEYLPLKETISSLSEELNAVIDSQISDWPSEVKAFDPGTDNIKERSEWVKKAKPLADKLMSQTAPNTENGDQTKGKNPPTDDTNSYLNRKYGRK